MPETWDWNRKAEETLEFRKKDTVTQHLDMFYIFYVLTEAQFFTQDNTALIILDWKCQVYSVLLSTDALLSATLPLAFDNYILKLYKNILLSIFQY